MSGAGFPSGEATSGDVWPLAAGGGLNEEDTRLDLWVLAGLPGSLSYPAYLTARHTPQYRLILDVLLAAQAHSLTGTAEEDLPGLLEAEMVSRALDPAPLLGDGFDLESRLKQLLDWQVVERWQARADTEADFLRNRWRYQVTPEAARLHRFISEVMEATGEESSTALLAPPIIAVNLEAILAAIDNPDALVDAARLGDADRSWAAVQTTIRDMATAAGTWQNRMAAALAGAPSEDKLNSLRQTIIHYVEQWGAAIDVHTPRIAAALERLDHLDGLTSALAYSRQGADASEDVIERTARESRSTFDALRAWFVGADCDARHLRRQVRDAVTDLLRAQRALLIAGNAVSRRREMLAVAEAVQMATNEDDAWAVWGSTTGLFSAAHLAIPGAAEDARQPRVSYWETAPAPVEVRLRTHGARAKTGRAARAADRSAARRAARQAAEARRVELEEAARGIIKRSGTPLSDWEPLSAPEADLFLALLSAARRAPADEEGVRSGKSGDGRWTVRLTHIPGAPSAVIHFPNGKLAMDDATLEVAAL